jgi:nitroreductase
MDFSEVIKKRRSIRKFKTDEVPDDVLTKILDDARLSPTWANMQGARFIVVKESEKVKAVAEATGQKWALGAPMFIVVCISPKASGKNMNKLEYYMCDASICMEHIILSATNEGLGTCWMGWFNEQKIKEILEIPEEGRVIALTPVGYPDHTPGEQKRKTLNEVAFKEKYGNPW